MNHQEKTLYRLWAWYPDGFGIRLESMQPSDREAIAWMNETVARYSREGRGFQAYYLSEGTLDFEKPTDFVPPREIASFNVVAYAGD